MIEQILAKFPIISDQVSRDELAIILKKLDEVINSGVEGDIVEMGCFVGTTSLFIQRILLERDQTRDFHVYDSFAGLPVKSNEDSSPAGMQFTEGKLIASKKEYIQTFHRSNLKLPIIHKGWFSELTDLDIPGQIAFAFLDGDYYDSIKDCLKLISAKLQPRSIVVIDDYQNIALPGVKRAVDEWLVNKEYRMSITSSLAIAHI